MFRRLPEATAAAIEAAYARLAQSTDESDRIANAAKLLLAISDDFYEVLCDYPFRAKRAFETMDAKAAVRISEERLGLYSEYISLHGPRIAATYPALREAEHLWAELDRAFLAMIEGRYEADIAFSFAHSLRRNICQSIWKPVAYTFPAERADRHSLSQNSVFRRFTVNGEVDAALIADALRMAKLSVPFRNLLADAQRIAARVIALRTTPEFGGETPTALEMIDAGFFRDRSAYVVGRWIVPGAPVVPFVVALLNSREGVYADALLYRTADVHNLFSSTLANFHVTTALYDQVCVFLYSLMPRRPLGLHYSTIGFNHVGKVAILDDIDEQMRESGQRFGPSPGHVGSVAIGFTFDACAYHLKVIRDVPTETYKWGAFPGVPRVIEKYRTVHDINRAGSMLDNVMYFNLKLDRAMFEPAFLEHVCRFASQSVQLDGDSVFVRSLIAQRKIVPLPIYTETASSEELRQVMISLGQCIRNNTATNIFNKDLDARNYGVGRYGKVFLFDYDAVEKVTDIKIRTNADREPGEETVPEWFFEDGIVFLPEEIASGLLIRSDAARRWFKAENADLMSVDYWVAAQERLARGEVLDLQNYPGDCRLR
jgi:isocitrate dehydrogenase kinase/phosphatase